MGKSVPSLIAQLSKRATDPRLATEGSELLKAVPQMNESNFTEVPGRIAEDLSAVFPELEAVVPLRLLGEGFRSIALETAVGQVFRIGRSPEATEGHLKELRLLPHLHDRLPAAIPQPIWYCGPSERFPFGVIGYPKLPGTPLIPEMLSGEGNNLIAELAAFLAALHRFPPREVLSIGVPILPTFSPEVEAMRDEVLPALSSRLTQAEYERVARWWESFLSNERMRRYKPALVHGDLWYENVLVDERGEHVLGVVDFEGASLADPATDFAAQFYLGEPFVVLLWEQYAEAGGTADEDLLYRAKRLWQLREFEGVQFSIRTDDMEELEDSILKLRWSGVL